MVQSRLQGSGQKYIHACQTRRTVHALRGAGDLV